MKKILFIVLVLGMFFAVGCTEKETQKDMDLKQLSVEDDSNEPVIVGGDKDEHGCIGSAGYLWCEEKQECIRPWEENCTTIRGFEGE